MTQQEHLITILIDEVKEFRKKGPSKQQLLDSFAKAAMQAIMGSDNLRSAAVEDSREQGLSHVDFVAQCAYDIATALMQERERRMKG